MFETYIAHHKSPINEYDFLAVRQGWNEMPVMLFEGRLCHVVATARTRVKKGWGYFNSYTVQFHDGEIRRIPAGQFNKAAKNAPLPTTD
jgi:hypothetical protein